MSKRDDEDQDPDEAQAEHRQIIDAIAKRDTPRAAAVARDHIEAAEKARLKVIIALEDKNRETVKEAGI